MSRLRFVARSPGLFLWLTAVWVGLWGSVTWANVLGGVAVSFALLVVLPLPPVTSRSTVRPWALLRFVLFFAGELVQASLTVVVQVLRPRSTLQQAVIAVPVRGVSDRLLTLVANAVSLTPGTLSLELDRPSSTLYVHVLDVGRVEGVEKVRRSILRLERFAILALGSAEALRALDAAAPDAAAATTAAPGTAAPDAAPPEVTPR